MREMCQEAPTARLDKKASRQSLWLEATRGKEEKPSFLDRLPKRGPYPLLVSLLDAVDHFRDREMGIAHSAHG